MSDEILTDDHRKPEDDDEEEEEDGEGQGESRRRRAIQVQSIKASPHYRWLLGVNYLFLIVGSVASTLLSKYYFNHKGSSVWVSTFVQSAGFPLLIPFIFLSPSTATRKPFSGVTPAVVGLSVGVGLMLGVNNFLFSWGINFLPVSTASLLLSTQLLFNLILSVLIVRQRITFHNLNTVILLTLSSVLLALTENNDRPSNVSKTMYFVGFFSTIGAGLLFALYLPVMERIYRRVTCYLMVVEMQLIMEAAATAFALIGMAAGGFAKVGKESREVFNKGEGVYWATVLANVVTWQMCFMGTAGMVFLTTSLTSGICMTALMTVNVLGGVLVYGDPFHGVKVVATVLCTWGFSSYVYGMYAASSRRQTTDDNPEEIQMSHQQPSAV